MAEEWIAVGYVIVRSDRYYEGGWIRNNDEILCGTPSEKWASGRDAQEALSVCLPLWLLNFNVVFWLPLD